MWVKVVIIILMLAILFSLFRGLFFLNKGGEENSRKVVKSLAWRIALYRSAPTGSLWGDQYA